MSARRSSARLASQTTSSPAVSQENSSPAGNASNKRKADSEAAPKGKRGRKGKAQQKTLEQTMPNEDENDHPNDIEMKEAAAEGEGTKEDAQDGKDGERGKPAGKDAPSCWFWPDRMAEAHSASPNDTPEQKIAGQPGVNGGKAVAEKPNTEPAADKEQDSQIKDENLDDEAMAAKADEVENSNGIGGETTKMDSTGAIHQMEEKKGSQDANVSTSNGAVEKSDERGQAMPSNILEKGIIYFFIRGRVGVDDPKSVQDVQRTHIVMRPLPNNAKLTDGPIEDLKNNRLLALPKKVLPRGSRDRYGPLS